MKIQMTSAIPKHCACRGTLTSPIYLTKYDHLFFIKENQHGTPMVF